MIIIYINSITLDYFNYFSKKKAISIFKNAVKIIIEFCDINKEKICKFNLNRILIIIT
jgi:hypothetical protein